MENTPESAEPADALWAERRGLQRALEDAQGSLASARKVVQRMAQAKAKAGAKAKAEPKADGRGGGSKGRGRRNGKPVS